MSHGFGELGEKALSAAMREPRARPSKVSGGLIVISLCLGDERGYEGAYDGKQSRSREQ